MVSVVFLTLLYPSITSASHTVRPLVLDYDLEPREAVETVITLHNDTNQIQRVYASVHAVQVDGDGQIQEFSQRSQSDNTLTVTSWISVERSRIQIPPNGTYEVPVTLQVHPNAKPGIYHAFIGFGSGRNRPIAEEVILQGQSPGTIVRISIADNATSFLRLDRFIADRFIFNQHTSAIEYILENPSDTPLVPTGEVIIYDTRGREVGAMEVNPEGISLAPGETHSFQQAVPGEPRIGRHKAFLSVQYGSTGQLASIQDTIFFYQIPLGQLSLIFLSVLLFACLVAYLVHRRYYHHNGADNDDVAVFVRDGSAQSSAADHDINLKHDQTTHNS